MGHVVIFAMPHQPASTPICATNLAMSLLRDVLAERSLIFPDLAVLGGEATTAAAVWMRSCTMRSQRISMVNIIRRKARGTFRRRSG